jgi:hypothetical protein
LPLDCIEEVGVRSNAVKEVSAHAACGMHRHSPTLGLHVRVDFLTAGSLKGDALTPLPRGARS